MLGIEQDPVVAGGFFAIGVEAVVHFAFLIAGCAEQRRAAERREGNGGYVERQAEREGDAFDDFRHGGAAAFGRDKVHPADLIILTEIAPIRPFGPVHPARHVHSPSCYPVRVKLSDYSTQAFAR